MYKISLFLCWLLCIGGLSVVRGDADESTALPGALLGDVLYNNYETINTLNEKIYNLSRSGDQRKQELSFLSYIVTIVQVLQRDNFSQAQEVPSHNITLTPAVQKCLTYNLQAVGHSCTEAPYQALLGYGEQRSTGSWMGYAGVIISDRYVLTCAWRALAFNGVNRVALGVTNLRGAEETWQVHELADTIVHPEYEEPNNDLALLKTGTLIQFSGQVQPACLPTPLLQDQQATLSTWRDSDTIRSVTVQKYSKDECFTSHGPGYNDAIHVCFGHRANLEDSCSTFAGDPVLVHSASCVATVVGTEAFWSGCSHPKVYTRVAHFVPWIERVVWP